MGLLAVGLVLWVGLLGFLLFLAFSWWLAGLVDLGKWGLTLVWTGEGGRAGGAARVDTGSEDRRGGGFMIAERSGATDAAGGLGGAQMIT